MIIVMLGAPGTGKGTISKLLSQYYQIPHISTGDLFRDAIRNNAPEAKILKDYMNKGLLIPDKYINEIIERRINQFDCKKGFIFDGYPRTIHQADKFEDMLTSSGKDLTAVINLETTDEEIIERIVNRLVCPNCKAIYNKKTMPPITEGICDVCDHKLVRREDDTEEKIKERLKEYYDKTEALVDYYTLKKDLFTVLVSEKANKLDKQVLKEIVWFVEGKLSEK